MTSKDVRARHDRLAKFVAKHKHLSDRQFDVSMALNHQWFFDQGSRNEQWARGVDKFLADVWPDEWAEVVDSPTNEGVD